MTISELSSPIGAGMLRAVDFPAENPHVSTRVPSLMTVGWREWIDLPAFGVNRIKAKIDTGARTSALHARELCFVDIGSGQQLAQFLLTADNDSEVHEALVVDHRPIRSSNGHDEVRAVIITTIVLGGHTWDIEVTLSDRELMGFPMLLGRTALRNRCLVDPNRSFCGQTTTS